MSWFNRKSKNRRHTRTHVLDVKLRSDQVRASRMRLIGMSLALIFATVFGFYLVWRTGEFALSRLIYENKAFAITEIDVQTDGVLAPDQLRRWAGVRTGENLFALDLARVKRDLEMVSVIKTVAVERVLPHSLRLRVTEREPLAQIRVVQMRPNGAAELGILHVDGDGYVMNLIEPSQRAVPIAVTNDTLPVISGINPADAVPGHRLDTAQARLALQLVSAFDHSPMSGLVDLQVIDVASPQILEVTSNQGSQITFSMLDLDRQLRRWRQIYDQGQRINKVIATLDLSVPNSIPAKWIEASAAPAVPPRNPNLQHNRKKNV
ncbi:MAG TPA: FtsQ-type POTRA domain-containing protein [Verrucomicrobiae bacterium]|jgi:cell division septal protein FtsQ|nr:FtsQ-type POTRA domain-containing protein [Verrucomicrobiae bacterium]